MLYFGEGGPPQVAPPGAVPVPERLQDLFDRPIEDLAELSVRSRNSLQKENIQKLGDLVQKTEEDMLGIENFGKKSLKEISDFLEEHGLRFGMKLEAGEDGQLFFVEEEGAEALGAADE
jgi:DNA-directed RNA polymerase subunit alpha